MNRKASSVLLIVILLLNSACAEQGAESISEWYMPPKGLTDTKLVGRWDAQYSAGEEKDTLILKPDRTFQQIYTTTWGYNYRSEQGEWWLEFRASGCAYLHLRGGKFFVDGPKTAARIFVGTGESLLEQCEQQRLVIRDEMVLSVSGALQPNAEIALVQLKLDMDSSDHFFIQTGQYP